MALTCGRLLLLLLLLELLLVVLLLLLLLLELVVGAGGELRVLGEHGGGHRPDWKAEAQDQCQDYQQAAAGQRDAWHVYGKRHLTWL